MFSYLTLERRIPADHPLQVIRRLADRALERMGREIDKLYAPTGRPSIAPEWLLRALLLMVLYSVRSERQLMEQLDYNLLFRWFVGLEMDDEVWDVTVFTKNRERLRGGGEPAVAGGGTGRGAGEGVVERRTLHRGWDADSSLGGEPELSEEERSAGSRPGIGTWGRGVAGRQSGMEDRPRGVPLQKGDGGQERAEDDRGGLGARSWVAPSGLMRRKGLGLLPRPLARAGMDRLCGAQLE